MGTEISIQPGSMTKEQLDCLIELSGVRSERVISALVDYCVRGEKKHVASANNGIQAPGFSRAIRSITRVNGLVLKYHELRQKGVTLDILTEYR